jgi:anti-sigma regulatory factor (Ser/Thr protein kinase)
MNETASQPEDTAITLEISGGPVAAVTARELVTELVGETTPAEKMHDLLLLTTELVTNAVRHAEVDEGTTLKLEVAATRQARRVAVIDPGGATQPRLQEINVEAPGGMGLFLVDQLSTRWGAEPEEGGGTRVWFELAA